MLEHRFLKSWQRWGKKTEVWFFEKCRKCVERKDDKYGKIQGIAYTSSHTFLSENNGICEGSGKMKQGVFIWFGLCRRHGEGALLFLRPQNRVDSFEKGESQEKSERMCKVCREITVKIDLVTDVFRMKIREKWM